MSESQRVNAMIDTLEGAKVRLGEAEAKQREAYQGYHSANGLLWQAQQSYRHARGQLEALAVQGLRMAPLAAPESLAGLQRREAQADRHVSFDFVKAGMFSEPGLPDEAIAELRQAEAEDNAAEQALDEPAAVFELEVVAFDPLDEITVTETVVAPEPEVQTEAPDEVCDDVQPDTAAEPDDDYGLSDPVPVSNRQPVPKPQVDEDQARIQVFQQALEQEYRTSLKPRIPRQNKEWQMLARSFTDPVLRLLDEAHGPVALAVICQTLKGLYTVETTKAYLRDMIAAKAIQKVGTGHYARADWRASNVDSQVVPPLPRGPKAADKPERTEPFGTPRRRAA